MSTATPAIQHLARRLLALEAARDPSDAPGGAAVRACDKLRGPLVKFAGAAGFRSLLSRAVALAAVEEPWLESVQVRPDGSLAWLDTSARPADTYAGGEPGAVVVAQLLGLLVTFIGEPLTLGLVRDAWPDAPADDTARSAEGHL